MKQFMRITLGITVSLRSCFSIAEDAAPTTTASAAGDEPHNLDEGGKKSANPLGALCPSVGFHLGGGVSPVYPLLLGMFLSVKESRCVCSVDVGSFLNRVE